MHKNLSLSFYAAFSIWFTVNAFANDYRGQATNTVSGLPVDGALVTLDLHPPDGSPEEFQITDPFGLFEIEGISDGTYDVLSTHPGYLPYTNTIALMGGTNRVDRFGLAPALGVDGAGFEILVEVKCVNTGAQLADVPVVAQRFGDPLDLLPVATTTTVTDATGASVYRGMRSGYYRFIANDGSSSPTPKWAEYSTEGHADDLTQITGPHLANFFLKPDPKQDLRVEVFGMNPLSEMEEPLPDIFVELEGLDPFEATPIVPPRTGMTYTNGIALFTELAAIPWRVTVKKMGYFPEVFEVWPDAAGDLTPNPLVVPLSIKPTKLIVMLSSPMYDDPEVLMHAPVFLEGLRETATAGIKRMAFPVMVMPGEVAAEFEILVPGRYRVKVADAAMSSPVPTLEGTAEPIDMFMEGDAIVDLECGVDNFVPLELLPTPATVRIRLFAADEVGRIENRLTPGVVRPIYQLREQTGIDIVPMENAPMLAGVGTHTVDTGPNGEVTVMLPPGNYAFQSFVMTNYWGSDILIADEKAGVEVDVGWPYPEPWPYVSTPKNSFGVPIESGGEYRIDLFVRKHKVQIEGEVFGDPGDPTAFQVLAAPATFDEINVLYHDLARGGGMVTLTGTGGPPVIVSMTSSNQLSSPAGASISEFYFDDVGSGSFTITATHPRNSLDSTMVGIAPWPRPGFLPPVSPVDPDWREPLSTVHAELTASYLGADLVSFDVYTYNTNTLVYDFSFHIDGAQVVQPKSYATNLYFSALNPMPVGEYEAWREFAPFGWFKGTQTGTGAFTVRLDGPSVNVDTNFAPEISYNLTIEARSVLDPDLMITGVSNVYAGGSILNTPAVTNDHEGPIFPLAFGHNTWVVDSSDTIITDPVEPAVKLLHWMVRGMGVSGTVTRAGSGTAISNALVQVRDRYGVRMRTARTDGTGKFVATPALAAGQTVFFDAQAQGFVPARSREVPDPNTGSGDLNVALTLEELPPPVVQSGTLDRYGYFLSAIKRAGNQSTFSAGLADEALSMTWTGVGELGKVTNLVQRYDLPGGGTNVTDTVIYRDPVTQVWLVDQRSFPEGFDNSDPDDITLPTGIEGYAVMKKFLDDIEMGFTNIIHSVSTRKEPGILPGVFRAGGSLKIWDLPPGEFKPAFIVITEGGLIRSSTVSLYPTTSHKLIGLRLPPWLAFLSDVLGAAAAIGPSVDFEADAVPAGRFIPLPTFDSSIDVMEDGGTPNGFLNYHYEFNLKLQEGMDSPSSGLAALGPGSLGVSTEVGMALDIDGKAAKATLSSGASIEVPAIPKDDPNIPKVSKSPVEVEGSIFGSFAYSSSSTFGSGVPLEFSISDTASIGASTKVKVNVEPFVAAVPVAGQVITFLNRTEILSLFGTLNGTAAVGNKTTWTTRFPPPRDSSGSVSTVPGEHVARVHALGGHTEKVIEPFLCWKMGAGVAAEALGGIAGIDLDLSLQGNKCGSKFDSSPKPGVFVGFNTASDWPYLTVIDGSINFNAEGYLKLGIIRLSKSASIPLLKFRKEFGTDPVFQLVELDLSTEILSPLSYSSATFGGETPFVLESFYPSGTYSVSDESGNVFMYADTSSTGMVLRVSTRGASGDWNAPIEIGTAGGFLSSAVAPLPAGGWVAIWNEISPEEIGNPFPQSRLMFSSSNVSGASWSAPAMIAAIDGMIPEMYLVRSRSFLGAVYLVADGGPFTSALDLYSSTWTGAAWTAPILEDSDVPVQDMDVAGSSGGTTPNIVLVHREDSGSLVGRSWDGATMGPAAILASGAVGGLGVDADTNGTFMIAYGSDTNGIAFLSADQTNGVVSLSNTVFSGLPVDLEVTALSESNETAFLVTWTEGAKAPAIWYGGLDSTGGVRQAISNLTGNVTGKYSDLRVLANTGLTATVMAAYTPESGDTDLRQFDVSLDPLETFHDIDGDGFNDFQELVIIDASPTDGVVSLDDVSPFGDFDNDGVENFAEFYLDLDATDPAITIAFEDIVVSNQTVLSFYASPNAPYTVEKSPELISGTGWTSLATTTTVGEVVEVIDTNTAPEHINYRINVPVPLPSP